MFDQRIIAGKMLGYSNIQHIDSDSKIQKCVANMFCTRSEYKRIQLDNVLLFDYIFAHKYGFLIVTDDISDSLEKRGMAFDGIDLYGIHFDQYINMRGMKSCDSIVFFPSEPYDRCTMQWDAYEDFYNYFVRSEIDITRYCQNSSEESYTSYDLNEGCARCELNMNTPWNSRAEYKKRTESMSSVRNGNRRNTPMSMVTRRAIIHHNRLIRVHRCVFISDFLKL